MVIFIIFECDCDHFGHTSGDVSVNRALYEVVKYIFECCSRRLLPYMYETDFEITISKIANTEKE